MWKRLAFAMNRRVPYIRGKGNNTLENIPVERVRNVRR